MTVGEFAEAAMQYCFLLDASVTSWGRSRAHNLAVDGRPFSGHRFFRGIDVVYDARPEEAVARETAARLGLWLLREGDHDHLQPLDWKAG